MRVLWFSNTPSLAAKFTKNIEVGSSWVESLEFEMMVHSKIELGIVFKELVKAPKEIWSEDSNTTYFMVPRHPFHKFNRWISRITARRPSQKPLQDYLRIVNDFKPDIVLFFGTESDFPLIIPKLSMPSIIWFQGNLTVYKRMYENGIPVNKTLIHERIQDIIMGNTLVHR
ncbi:hypothetical protein ACFLR9_10710, partial [Bacteroidota bacterium]